MTRTRARCMWWGRRRTSTGSMWRLACLRSRSRPPVPPSMPVPSARLCRYSSLRARAASSRHGTHAPAPDDLHPLWTSTAPSTPHSCPTEGAPQPSHSRAMASAWRWGASTASCKSSTSGHRGPTGATPPRPQPPSGPSSVSTAAEPLVRATSVTPPMVVQGQNRLSSWRPSMLRPSGCALQLLLLLGRVAVVSGAAAAAVPLWL
mmetsp:Transcript_42034/g.119336  ORF Transcript_42034/g.119336 Transcript_42034/m.119336 type:complete len:205 (+) Transcript_42034:965-1579(+)